MVDHIQINGVRDHAQEDSDVPTRLISEENTNGLESNNAFEGPEKLLEVWFSPTAANLPGKAGLKGLKKVSVDSWKAVLDIVHCKVLSVIESDYMDAYLLSESSLFVFPHKLVLKTCGTTTLLYGLRKILEIAGLEAGFPYTPAISAEGISATATTHRVFYSRKNFQFPDQQRGVHKSWRDEVQYLDGLFSGSAYMIGKMNGEHWYLYISTPFCRLTPPNTPEAIVEDDGQGANTTPSPDQTPSPDEVVRMVADVPQDETLEILMTDLDEASAKQFYFPKDGTKRHLSSANGSMHTGHEGGADSSLDVAAVSEGHALGSIVSEASGLSAVYPLGKYPSAQIDAYLFTPCGFSANGVVPAPSEADGVSVAHYFTTHVTPEPHCSYASFETNVPASQSGRETSDIVEHVVSIFKPGRFSVTLFEASQAGIEATSSGIDAARRSRRMESFRGYRRVDRIVHDLDGYDLVFRYFERLDWMGGAPRLGELSD